MGISSRSVSSIVFHRTTKIGPKVAAPFFLPSGDVASNPQMVADVWRLHFAKDFDHRIRQVPFQLLENVQCKICSQVLIRGVGDETSCVSGVQTEPQCVDWVDELSQVASAMRTGKAINWWTQSRRKRVVWLEERICVNWQRL